MLRLIPAVGRRLFLIADKVFNRLFGDAFNPLYYLGTISCLMFTLVTISGFYLYAFYDTGIDTTYASVEAITHGQRWVGGIMRSVHRYASDAMVLTMLLHLARHFSFDHYRGFRAFSWVSGMILLWLVYVSGVNGYMLPWDRLAQFTVTATAEWIDALPAFRGTLVRNFILPEAITDRFFSLLQFLHIGIPLAALAGLWIHIQRVPRARVLPPKPLLIGLLAMMLVLSVAKPVTSQGPAEMLSMPLTVEIDWFYLMVLPLVQSWDPMALWMAVGGATVLGILLPWLPPKRSGQVQAWQVKVHPGHTTLSARPGETLLEAGLRAELPIPFSCRAGGCGLCRARLLNGQVNDGGDQAIALTAEQRRQGDILLCCSCAESDVEIELDIGSVAAQAAAAGYRAKVVELTRLSPDVMKVGLELLEGRRMQFEAGQFIQVVLEDGQRRAYSFTVPSGETHRIDLHIRLMPGGVFTTRVFESMTLGDELQIEGPLGNFVLREPSPRPLIFVAGATGFAPVKSLLEEAFRNGLGKQMHFYWGVRRPQDLYMRDLPEQWAREHANFHFVPVISEPQPDDGWQGRTGLVHEAILKDFPDMSGHLVYACGSLRMVEAAKPAFLAQGLGEDACFSDAFTPAAGSTAAPH